MVKIFLTGDNHFGKKYNSGSYSNPEARKIIIQSRFDALKRMVDKAEEDSCELFVVAGDMFDNRDKITQKDVKTVVEILASFSGDVVVLPGNHDYYTEDEKVWKDFEKTLDSMPHNITLLNEFKPYDFEIGEESVVIFPAFCDAQYSEGNNLDWIKKTEIKNRDVINIGVAHGAIKGLTPDTEGQYFLMTKEELNEIPVDVWLIGHTHVPYPNLLKEDEDVSGFKIFNAGTHEQMDIHNNSEGNGFIISVEKDGDKADVKARRYVSGKIRYYEKDIEVISDSERALDEALKCAVKDLDDNSIVRLNIKGAIQPEEYTIRQKIYKENLDRFISYKIDDGDLSEKITIDKIRSEFPETGFSAKLLEELLDKPIELQMAYQLLSELKK